MQSRKSSLIKRLLRSMRQQSGVSLPELLITGGVLAIIIASATKFLADSGKSVRAMRTVTQRDRIFEDVQRIARNSITLKTSIETDPELAPCLNSGCALAAAGKSTPLFTPGGNSRVAGTVATPAFYTEDGSLCVTANKSCPLKVVAEIQAICANGSFSPCNAGADPAHSFSIHLTIFRDSTSTALGTPLATRTTKGDATAVPAIAPFPILVTRDEILNPNLKIPTSLECKRVSKPWGGWPLGSTIQIACPVGYNGVTCITSFYDDNGAGIYLGTSFAQWNATRDICSSTNNDGGINQGQVSAECCRFKP